MNPDYQELGIEPFDLVVRNKIGLSLELSELSQAAQAVHTLLHEEMFSESAIMALRNEYLYNVGTSAEAGANYIIKRLIEKSKDL